MAKRAPSKKIQAKPPSAAAARTGQKKPAKSAPVRERLENELIGMIPELDAEGLLFLVRQAGVLIQNRRVDELNAEMEKLNKDKMAAHKRAGTTARVGQNVEEITVEMQRSPDSKTFYMIVNGQKHFLTPGEMSSVVKLCFKPERKSDAIRFLFKYLNDERKEILMDHGVSSDKHPFFEALFHETRAKFSLKD
jgi:hypothetical protein